MCKDVHCNYPYILNNAKKKKKKKVKDIVV